MGLSKLPRFHRTPPPPSFALTKRDEGIIRLIHERRFLRSSHITALIGGSSQQIIRRLQLLYHHGYLERPRIQIEYFGKSGSKAIAYGLGNKGAKLLKKRGIKLRHTRWSEKNQGVRRMFLEHALALSDFMVKLALSLQNHQSFRLISEALLRARKRKEAETDFRWRVSVRGRGRLGIIPDAVCSIEKNEHSPNPNPAFFFIEVDRGTMPVMRENLVRTSMFRKLLAYEATWKSGLHKRLFGFHRFRVLIVTTSAARRATLVNACKKLESGRGLFLFCDQETLASQPNVLDIAWETGKGTKGKILP